MELPNTEHGPSPAREPDLSSQRKKRTLSSDDEGFCDDGVNNICSEENDGNLRKVAKMGKHQIARDSNDDCEADLKELPGKKRSVQSSFCLPDSFTCMKIKRLRLEGLFHPKFENESAEKDVRRDMLSKVEKGEGYLEVTLKHSGSLLLWSGGNRFYSKNDANNLVSLVGEFLLRRHMSFIWGSCDGNIDNEPSDKKRDDAHLRFNRKYDECSDFIEEQRLTLAFEVVTEVLGDHGDTPKHPYLILLSVVNRNTQQFYTSHQLIEFAHKFRLPHNDYWIIPDKLSCNRFFQLYDNLREIGTTDLVIDGLDQLVGGGDTYNGLRSRRIVSMYPHLEYQGEILEGLVVRFVDYDEQSLNGVVHCDRFLESLNLLANVADEHLAILRNNTKLTSSHHSIQLHDFFLSDTNNAELQLRSFLKHQTKNEKWQQLKRVSDVNKAIKSELPSWIVSSLFDCRDEETKKIIQLIQTLQDMNVKVDYKIYNEQKHAVGLEEKERPLYHRWIVIIHVLHDETFKKYRQSSKGKDQMQLFRGFSFELIFDGTDVCVDNPGGMLDSEGKRNASPLMLKLKLLPYLVRTFGCRNGLRVLSSSGLEAYERYTLELLSKWNISHSGIKKWQPYFYNWGLFADSALKRQRLEMDGSSVKTKSRNTSNTNPISSRDSQSFLSKGELNEGSYLRHLCDFDNAYKSGKNLVGCEATPQLRGIIIVLSLTMDASVALGSLLAQKLGIHRRMNDTNSISEVEMLSSILGGCGNALVCATTIEASQAPIKKLSKKKQFASAIYIVLFGCADEDIDRHFDKIQDRKRVRGKKSSWNRLPCREIFHVPHTSKHDSGPLAIPSENKEISEVVATLIELSKLQPAEDKPPGILVFFPGIPGCGKSSLCSGCNDGATELMNEAQYDYQSQQHRRPIVICEGDKVKGNYWSHVLHERLRNPSSILLADKNATPVVWGTIREICGKSNVFPIPVCPDSSALSTVTVEHSQRKICYPFSLSYLAVCMLRVMMRPEGSHNGKLDRSAENALMVVVKFYCLYRGISAENFLPMIRKQYVAIAATGVSRAVITIPFFNDTASTDIPQKLRDCLIDALQLQHSIDRDKDICWDSESSKMEGRLRSQVSFYQEFLKTMCVSEEESKKAFGDQLSNLSSTLNDNEPLSCSAGDAPRHKFIEIASIDIDPRAIHSLLSNMESTYTEVENFLARAGGLRNLTEIADYMRNDATTAGSDSETAVRGSFVKKPHVTMAHFTQLSQQNLFNTYHKFEGSSTVIRITSILIGKSVAAFSVLLPEKSILEDKLFIDTTPPCQNVFPHVTIWVGENETAARSNDLPVMVENGEAIRIEFAEKIEMSGNFTFWFL